jgi:hypothetical protein
MSMSTHVVGSRPADEKWRKMKAVYDACTAASMEVPKEVEEFFGHERPDEAGVKIDLSYDYRTKKTHESCSAWKDDMQEGYEIDVSKLPKDVKIIRFYNSW